MKHAASSWADPDPETFLMINAIIVLEVSKYHMIVPWH